jgi:acyl-CoA reductase-like NAD-dependent aldehyde dehydrogenase
MVDPRTLTPRWPRTELLIDGQSVAPLEGGTLALRNPATGDALPAAPAAGPRDVEAAVLAARRAFDVGPWPRMNASARGRLLRKLADALWERREEFALIESLNNGKTFAEALKGDVAPGAATLAYASEWANKVLGEVVPVDGTFLTYVLREPVGVVAAIVPWNYPTSLACWKVGPALATGCTVVLKPSELTPLTAMKLGELAREVGFPDGVLNVLPGEGMSAGEALARHPGVDKVAFTGSIRTARRLLHASADTNLKRLSLELGGKSPQVVLADANFAQAVEACLWGIFGCKGEVCSAGSRVIVEARLYEAFVEALAERARALRVGDPLDPATEMGAQVTASHLDTILGYVASGKAEGARLVAGGARDTQGDKARGNYLQPTVFSEVRPGMRIAEEEIFGPVVACMRVQDAAEAIALANATPYGLGASLWTSDVARAHALARRLKSGVVWINCFNEFDDAAPFGGVKQSGWGRDLSQHALHNYLEYKTVWTRLSDA